MNRIQFSRRKHLGVNAGFIASILATGRVGAQEDFMTTGAPEDFMTSFDSLKNSLVRISGDRPIGSGFIGQLEGRQYIFSNASVISGHNKLSFQNLEGKAVIPKKIELSASRDLVRFLVEGERAFNLNLEIIPDEVISVLDYSKKEIITHSGVITGSSTHMIEINAEFKQESSGSPLLDSRLDCRGVANHLIYYKAEGPDWVGTPRNFAYKLDGADWYTAKWHAYNKTYGKNLRDVDHFRTVVYSIAQLWVKRPKDEIELTERANFEFERWVKEYNGMISDLTKSHSRGSMSEANEKIQKRFQGSCAELIKICNDKAEFLGFLCNDKKITPYLRIQFKWRSLELKKFCRFIAQHAKNHRRDKWI